MEHLGDNLAERVLPLDDLPRIEKAVPWRVLREVLRQILQHLVFMHETRFITDPEDEDATQHLVHRDLKFQTFVWLDLLLRMNSTCAVSHVLRKTYGLSLFADEDKTSPPT